MLSRDSMAQKNNGTFQAIKKLYSLLLSALFPKAKYYFSIRDTAPKVRSRPRRRVEMPFFESGQVKKR